jgi:hypothetical protein
MALGENPTVGNWRGAGTNGGTQLAIVRSSVGMVLPFASDWWPLFAGLQLYAGIAIPVNTFNPKANDEIDSSSFGTQVGLAYAYNPGGSVKDGYLNAISNVTEGSGCPGGFPGGMQGCGCHAIMTLSNTAAGGTSTINEDWYALAYANSNQEGASYYYWYLECNYNFNNSWSGGP